MISEEPRFLQNLQDVVADEQSTAVFTCEVNRDDIAVDWYLNEKKLTSHETYTVHKNGYQWTLTVHCVSEDQEGLVEARCGDACTGAYLSLTGLI